MIAIGNYIGRRGAAFDWAAYCTPLNLILTEIVGGVQLDWSSGCTDEDGFEIWISIDGADYVLLDTVAADVVTYDDLTDYSGSTVEYKIRAYKGTAYSEYSAEAEITIDAEITDLAAAWINDFARITFNGTAGWETEIYESRDDITYSLVTTLADGVETYDNYTWQGTTVYFKARAKLGAAFGPYCADINIATPLVFKWDCDPVANLVFNDDFNLPAGKTVTVNWGDGHSNDYITTGAPQHTYTICTGGNPAPAQDPYYIQMSGDVDSITQIYIARVGAYGDISKWIIPPNLILIRAETGTQWSGDLSSWILPASFTMMYVQSHLFTNPPRGHIENIENSMAGFWFNNNQLSTAVIDAWLAWANSYLATTPPIRSGFWQFAGAGNGIPTGGNANTDLVACRAKYVAAGFTLNATVRTS